MAKLLVAVAGVAAAILGSPAAAQADLPISLLSTGSADRGRQTADAPVWHAADPGSDRVVFSTTAALEPEDADAEADLYERAGGRTRLLTPAAGVEAARIDFLAASSDASRVLVRTYERLTGEDGDEQQDLYLCEGGQVRLATPGTPGDVDAAYRQQRPLVARDLHRVLIRSADPLSPADQNATSDLYVAEDGRYALVSGGRAGEQLEATLGVAMTADGARVAFASTARLRPDIDADDIADIYLWKHGEGYELLTPPGAGGPAFPPYVWELSPDGTRAVVTGYDRMAADDGDELQDVYRVGIGVPPVRVSRGNKQPADSGGLVPTGVGFAPDLSRIWFATRAQHDVADTDAATDIYVWSGERAELATPGTAQDVSVSTPMPYGSVRDGAGYVFATSEVLTPADRNDRSDVYEAAPGAPPRLRSDGVPGEAADLAKRGADGSLLLRTRAPLVAADGDGRQDHLPARRRRLDRAGHARRRAARRRLLGRERRSIADRVRHARGSGRIGPRRRAGPVRRRGEQRGGAAARRAPGSGRRGRRHHRAAGRAPAPEPQPLPRRAAARDDRRGAPDRDTAEIHVVRGGRGADHGRARARTPPAPGSRDDPSAGGRRCESRPLPRVARRPSPPRGRPLRAGGPRRRRGRQRVGAARDAVHGGAALAVNAGRRVPQRSPDTRRRTQCAD